jgi:hypothetical protein
MLIACQKVKDVQSELAPAHAYTEKDVRELVQPGVSIETVIKRFGEL